MCICGVESGQMYFSVYYTPVRALFLSKYMAAQMGISREKTATVKTLFNAQLDKILTPRVSSQKSRVIGLEVSTNSDKFKWMGSHLRWGYLPTFVVQMTSSKCHNPRDGSKLDTFWNVYPASGWMLVIGVTDSILEIQPVAHVLSYLD